jgi:hypothetical protein
MSGSICVTKMIYHMCDEVDRVMKGTKHEGEEKFYHNALTLMTCETSKAYMCEHNLLKYWLLPIEGLNYSHSRNPRCAPARTHGQIQAPREPPN